jgi:phosphoribosylformylglycinamidine synthase
MEDRGGLMLGICNGFQALIKLGLVPYGKITDPGENGMTLTHNKIGRHVSRLVRTRVSSVLSPWFAGAEAGDIHAIPVSHGEGRLIASDGQIAELIQKGQIAAQYVDFSGNASMDIDFNPNCSACAVEAVSSPDGRILGKMAHSERIGENLYKNAPGNYDQKIFESGVKYFQ